MVDALIKRIDDAVKTGHINEPFTGKNAEDWMSEHEIMKEDGTPYSKGYVTTLLSDSRIMSKKTKNRNSKWLIRRRNNEGRARENRNYNR